MSPLLFLSDLIVLLENANFRNILDFILVWIVVYRVLLFTKSSGSFQVVVGIIFIGFLYILSAVFELITFHWLLETFFSNLILIVFILFQKEIRQALAQIGSNPMFSIYNKRFSSETGTLVDELSKGLVQLSQRAQGALVVIEQEMDLDYYIETGVKLDSEIRADLLVSLFNPKSPTHDGAILIRGRRVSFAGCFLPLSRNIALDKSLGTRHRAALGLSDETDATVFLVSEEKKAVICVERGKLSPPMEHNELRAKIYEIFIKRKKI